MLNAAAVLLVKKSARGAKVSANSIPNCWLRSIILAPNASIFSALVGTTVFIAANFLLPSAITELTKACLLSYSEREDTLLFRAAAYALVAGSIFV